MLCELDRRRALGMRGFVPNIFVMVMGHSDWGSTFAGVLDYAEIFSRENSHYRSFLLRVESSSLTRSSKKRLQSLEGKPER